MSLSITETLGNVTDFVGRPWAEETRIRVLEYILAPSKELWDDIHCIIINRRGTTIWQAVCRLDPSFPKTGRRYDLEGNVVKDYERIPSPFTVQRAIEVELGCQERRTAEGVLVA